MLLLTTVAGFYSEGSVVKSLTEGDFKRNVRDGGYWLVEFYAPWCGHCKNLKPEYDKVAKGLEGVVNVAAVDCDANKGLAGEYGVKGFPTIKLFYTSSKGHVVNTDYAGGRTGTEIVTWVLDQVKKAALKRMGAKEEKKQKSSSGFYGPDSDVVNLGSSNFGDLVQKGDDLWMMEFYAPWCGHCKNLKSDWEHVATELKGKVKVGAVDCTAHERLCGEFDVKGFPTLKFFGSNKRAPEDYNGGRDAASIAAFALGKWSTMSPPPEVKELTESFLLEKHCTGGDGFAPKQLCLIVFLPHILDSKAAGRNNYLTILQNVSVHYKEHQFGYLWAEGGKQKKLEEIFGIGGFGYPAAVLFSPKKTAYTILKSGLDTAHCIEFIDSLRHGFEKVIPLSDPLSDPETTIPWDGKDMTEELQDEFDLEDIMNEEL